jgi:hypothetical protein
MMRKILLVVAVLLVVGTSALLYRMMDSTEYSPGYSEKAFKEVREGMTEADVRRLLGEPLLVHLSNPGVTRWYGPPGSWVNEYGGLICPSPDWSNLAIIQFDPTGEVTMQNPWARMSPDQITALLGKPIKEVVSRVTVCWVYTRSEGSYYRRSIGFDQSGKVVEKTAYYYWD